MEANFRNDGHFCMGAHGRSIFVCTLMKGHLLWTVILLRMLIDAHFAMNAGNNWPRDGYGHASESKETLSQIYKDF